MADFQLLSGGKVQGSVICHSVRLYREWKGLTAAGRTCSELAQALPGTLLHAQPQADRAVVLRGPRPTRLRWQSTATALLALLALAAAAIVGGL